MTAQRKKHRPTDPCRNLSFSEEDGFRYLHFGSPWIQGAMNIRRPYDLVLQYPRQMMACGLFYPNPTHILQLGLGAASLTKFCLRYTQAQVDVVEISPTVVAAATQWFRLPADHERLTVHVADAKDYLKDTGGFLSPDWLQVDLYDAQAQGPVYDTVDFYALCRRAMNREGAVASFNLFGCRFEKSFSAIDEAFEGRTLMMPEIDEGNRVVLAFVGPEPQRSIEALYEQAHRLRDRWKLPAIRWVQGLKGMQPQWFNHN